MSPSRLGGDKDLDFVRLGHDAFAATESESIDYAVMERTENAVVIPAEMGWSDVGGWNALWEATTRDTDGNVIIGDIVAEDVAGSYLEDCGRALWPYRVSTI